MTRRVGRYLILRELGSGGMAKVYLARQAELDRLVALKELTAVRLSEPAFTRRFLREAQVAASLTHPNIVTVHDYFELSGTPYIAMEYVAGGALRPYIGRLSLAQIGGVLAAVLAGLAHAERRSVVHRDLKPENLMVTDDGQVKITDFGIAKATSSVRTAAQLTATGTTLGTPHYMAPEQAMGQQVGPWSDLYSVGIVAFEMLVGKVPFRDTEEPMAVLMRQVKEPIPAVAKLRPDVEPAISDWVGRLLVKDPKRRTRSAVSAWHDLEEALIAALGPRWNRHAALTGGGASAVPSFETPSTAQLRNTGKTPVLDRTSRTKTLLPRTTAPTQERPPPRGHRRRKLAVPLLVLPLLTGVALAVARTRSDSSVASGSAPTQVTASRELSLAVPNGWQPLAAIPATGLPLTHARALAPGGRQDRPAVVYGLMAASSAGNSALLPPAFLASLGRPASQLPPRTRVTLSAQALPAWRYRKLRPLGSTRELTAYVVPTSAGVATVACLAPPGGRAMRAKTCHAIASTLHLLRGGPYPIGASDAYAAALTSILGSLRPAAGGHGQTLALARTKRGRASAAKGLAGDYRRASRQFAALNLSPADYTANHDVVVALQRTGRAYAAVARVAAHRGTAAVASAQAKALRSEKAIDGALAAVRAAGYAAKTGGGQTPSGGAGSKQSPPTSSSPSKCPKSEQSDDASDDAGGCGEA